MGRISKFLQIAGICAGLSLGIPAFYPQQAEAEEPMKTLDVLFTSDTHSHLNSFSLMTEDGVESVGGFARIKTLIEEQKEENPDTLVVDAGDFSMGTLVQTIFSTEASELRMLGYLGMDATTLGNHEFDYRSRGLADMLERAAATKEPLPQMLVCNIDWEAMEENMTDGQKVLSDAFHVYGVSPYTILQKGDVKIAVLGVFGKDALSTAPTCELEFKDPVLSVKQTVEEIKRSEDADIIVCLSHCGTNENPKYSEDEELAQEVPDLDLIISGHSHRELEEPLVYEDTCIAACGEYGKKLGSLSLEQKGDGRWKLADYELIPVDEEVPIHIATQDKIDYFLDIVNETYLKDFGYTADEKIAYNPYEFSAIDEIYEEHTEQNLGNIIADAYRYGAMQADKDAGAPAVTLVPSGSIRETYMPGYLTVEDIFDSFSLGIGKDGKPGYPLVSVYLDGKELKNIAEIDATVSDYMTAARIFCNGMVFSFNPNRLPFNRVTDVYLTDENGARQEIEDDKLYRVIGDLYTGQMLGAVSEQSYGLLSIVPKYADGTPITDIEDAIIYDGADEVKVWYAIASYMESFPKNEEGIAQIPDSCRQLQGRKILEDETGLRARFGNLNCFGTVMVLAALLFIVIAAVIAGIIIKMIKKKIRR